MLSIIYDFLHNLIYGVPELAGTVQAIGPLGIAAIGAGSSILGGVLSGFGNRRNRVAVPDELNNLIDQLNNPNFFRERLQRLVNTDQGIANIEQSLAARGVDSPAIASEQRQALERQRGEAISTGTEQLESTRLNALNRALAQRSQINAQNARLAQQQTNNTLGILSQTVSGVGSSLTQGLGAQVANRQLDALLGSMGGGGSIGETNTPSLGNNYGNFGSSGLGVFSGSPLLNNLNSVAGLPNRSGRNAGVGLGSTLGIGSYPGGFPNRFNFNPYNYGGY